MKMALEASGGMTVQTDTFHNPVFRDSLQRVFAKPGDAGHMGIASNAIFEVSSAWPPVTGSAQGEPPMSHVMSCQADADRLLPHSSATCFRFMG